jgi:hypothetical protein
MKGTEHDIHLKEGAYIIRPYYSKMNEVLGSVLILQTFYNHDWSLVMLRLTLI